jgi:hypothetical protein
VSFGPELDRAGVIERVDDQVLLELGAQALLGLCRRGDLINCRSSGGVQDSERALSAA